MQIAAPNLQLCASHVVTGIETISTPNGGSARVLLDLPDHWVRCGYDVARRRPRPRPAA